MDQLTFLKIGHIVKHFAHCLNSNACYPFVYPWRFLRATSPEIYVTEVESLPNAEKQRAKILSKVHYLHRCAQWCSTTTSYFLPWASLSLSQTLPFVFTFRHFSSENKSSKMCRFYLFFLVTWSGSRHHFGYEMTVNTRICLSCGQTFASWSCIRVQCLSVCFQQSLE